MAAHLRGVRLHIIIADTSVLLNFIKIERLDLIAKHSHEFAITDHVRGEVSDPNQQQQLAQAIKVGAITERPLLTPDEVQLFGELLKGGRLGEGECSAISCAIHGGHKLAIDDTKATKKALKTKVELTILGTPELMVSMICENLLTIDEADRIKEIWRTKFQYAIKEQSFADLLD